MPPSPRGGSVPARRGAPLRVAVAVIVLLVALSAVAYYWPTLSGVRRVNPTARGKVLTHVGRLTTALEARDIGLAAACLDTHETKLHESAGKLTGVQPRAFDPRPGPVLSPDKLVPTEPLDQASVEFEPGAAPPRVLVTCDVPDNKKVVFVVYPAAGGWVVHDLIHLDRSAQRGREWALP